MIIIGIRHEIHFIFCLINVKQMKTLKQNMGMLWKKTEIIFSEFEWFRLIVKFEEIGTENELEFIPFESFFNCQ